jgi:hypothetical protein
VEYLIVLSISAVWAGLVGRSKGSSGIVWFFIGVGAIIPFLGVIIAVLYRHEDDELRRQCPTCGRIVKLHDALCTRCGTELDFPEVAIEPESAARAH